MPQTQYNPEQFVETTVRALKDYAEDGFSKSVRDGSDNPVGDEIYQIVMEFPSTEDITSLVPMGKTIIHFEVDALQNITIGFGDNVFKSNYDAVLGEMNPQESAEHRFNFDVGIWTSDRAGGITSRLRAYQVLRNLFHGGLAFERCKAATAGRDDQGEYDGALEILDFTGGRFITDRVNDVNVYRLIDCALTIRVYSRTPLDVPVMTIEEIDQDENLSIDDVPL